MDTPLLTAWRQSLDLGFSRRRNVFPSDLNPFSPKPPATIGKFDCYLLSRLARKKYFENVQLDQHLKWVNVLAVSSENFVDYLSAKCSVSHRGESTGIVKEELACGETRVLNAAFDGSSDAREELLLRCEGRLPFDAQSLQENSWWRRLLWRQKYQSTAPKKCEKPHVVVIGNNVPPSNAEWLQNVCKKHEIPVFQLHTSPHWAVQQMTKEVKECLIRNVMQDFPLQKQAYQLGYALGRRVVEVTADKKLDRAEEEGYTEGRRMGEAMRAKAQKRHPEERGDWDSQVMPKESLLPEHFKCPITKEPIYDPVITKYGYTYERVSIESYVQENQKDFVTGRPLQLHEMYPNKVIKPFLQWIRDNSILAEAEYQKPFFRIMYKAQEVPLTGPSITAPR